MLKIGSVGRRCPLPCQERTPGVPHAPPHTLEAPLPARAAARCPLELGKAYVKHDGQSDLRDLIQGLFDDPERRGPLTLQALREHWADIVGVGLADKTHPGKLDGRLLWVWARDSAWVYQLQFFKEDLLRSVQTFLESDEISDMRFRLGTIPEHAPATTATVTPAEPAAAGGGAPTMADPPDRSPPAATHRPHAATPAARHAAKSATAAANHSVLDAEDAPDAGPVFLVRDAGGDATQAHPAEPDTPPEDAQAAARTQRMAQAIPDPLLRARFLRAYARGRQRRSDDEPPQS